MEIKRTKPKDAVKERYIITALIMSDEVCRSLYKVYDPKYFQSKLSREVANWCFEFFNQYDASPKMEISAIFETKTKSGFIDPDLGDEIEVFLESISQQYENSSTDNHEYYLKMAMEYFKARSYIILAEKIKSAVDNEDIKEADKTYASFSKVLEQQDTSREVFSDAGINSFKQSIISAPPDLFCPPGAIGSLIGMIRRATFIGILGREKVGKTYALFMLAVMAAKAGLNVAFIETGDMTLDQLDNRFYNYITRKTNMESKAGIHLVPVLDCLHNQFGDCPKNKSKAIAEPGTKGRSNYFIVDHTDPDVLKNHTPCIRCWKDRHLRMYFKGSAWWQEEKIGVWSWPEVRKESARFKRYFKGRIITEAYNMQSVRMSDIRDWLIYKRRENDPFIPHLILIDYPDIIIPERNMEQFRHQENQKWMMLKGVSQEFNCCVIAPTQADAKSYNKDTLQLDNYSEDKRKYGHVTHFYSYNKTDYEEEMGIARLATLILREDSVKIGKQVSILQCLVRSQPYITSFIGRVPVPLNRVGEEDFE